MTIRRIGLLLALAVCIVVHLLYMVSGTGPAGLRESSYIREFTAAACSYPAEMAQIIRAFSIAARHEQVFYSMCMFLMLWPTLVIAGSTFVTGRLHPRSPRLGAALVAAPLAALGALALRGAFFGFYANSVQRALLQKSLGCPDLAVSRWIYFESINFWFTGGALFLSTLALVTVLALSTEKQ